MSVIKVGYTRALEAYPGPVIPYPNLITNGVADTIMSNELNDSTAHFLDLGISPGDVVYNDGSKTSAVVLDVISEISILLSANIFTSPGESYRIFKAANRDTIGNQGATLYAPTSGNVSFVTIGGDPITIAVVAGSIIPLQVKSITSTSVTGLIALW